MHCIPTVCNEVSVLLPTNLQAQIRREPGFADIWGKGRIILTGLTISDFEITFLHYHLSFWCNIYERTLSCENIN